MIPGLGRSAEGVGYPFQYSWVSPVAQLVKNLPAMWETWVRALGSEDPLENVPCGVEKNVCFAVVVDLQMSGQVGQ